MRLFAAKPTVRACMLSGAAMIAAIAGPAMAQDADALAAIEARLERLEAENARLRGEVEALRQPTALQPRQADATTVQYDRLPDADGKRDTVAERGDDTIDGVESTALVGIDPESYVRQVDGLHDAFTPEFVASWSPVPGSGKRTAHRAAPVFLVGFPRSGTTLLDQIFDAHPDVQALEERPTLVALVENLRAKKAGYPGSLASLSEKERDRLSDLYYEEAERHGVDFTRHVVVDKMPLDLVHAVAVTCALAGAVAVEV